MQPGSTIEPSFLLDPFATGDAGGRPDMLVAQSSGVDARGRLERYPTPDGDGLVPVLRVDDLPFLLRRSDGFPTGARLEMACFLYAVHIPWDRFHGLRIRGACRRWQVAALQRRDAVWSEPAEPRIARTTLDRVPAPAELDDRSLVERVLRRP